MKPALNDSERKSLQRRIRLKVAYDGTDYRGWQFQPEEPTIQGHLEDALEKILGEKVRVTGAGRTDTGVHALGQVAHFDTLNNLPAKVIERALNATLPREIRVRQVTEACETFHARHWALWKMYRYGIADMHLPESIFLDRTNWLRNTSVDLETLNQCCSIVLGEHDFATFSKKEGARENHLCRVYEAYWKKEETSLSFEIKADRFLRGMVRMLVGGMIAVAGRRTTVDDFSRALASPGRWRMAEPAPACGLTLVQVEYPEKFK